MDGNEEVQMTHGGTLLAEETVDENAEINGKTAQSPLAKAN